MRHGVVFLDVMGMSLLRRTYKADEGGPSLHLAEVRTRWRSNDRFESIFVRPQNITVRDEIVV